MKLYWGSSVGRGYDPDHVTSLVDLLGHSPHPIYFRPIHGDALIERSRARSATAFLEQSDAEVWLSVDTDIIFPWQGLVQIAEQAKDRQAIVVGAYVTRSPVKTFPTSLLERGQAVEFATDPTPVPIRWGATGFMAVHRSVFERLAKDPEMVVCHANDSLRHRPFFLPFITEGSDGPILLSEDFAFCQRAARLGISTFLNPAVRLGHLGPYCYRLDDLGFGPPPKPTPLRVTRLEDGFPARYRVESPEPEGVGPDVASANGRPVRA